jgi:hypothetical protein
MGREVWGILQDADKLTGGQRLSGSSACRRLQGDVVEQESLGEMLADVRDERAGF